MNRKLFISLLLCGFLVACSSMSSQGPDKNEEDAKKVVAADADIQLGMAYLQKNDVALAKQKFLMALDLAPNHAPSWYAMGYYLEVTGEIQKANEYYLHAISLAPHSGDAQNNYGTFLCHTGKPKESIEHFVTATEDPDYVDTGAAYENAGLCALKIPDTAMAKKFFAKAVNHDPKLIRSFIELAKIDYEQGNYVATSNILQKAFATSEPTPEALLLAAKVSKKLNQPQAAQKYLAKLQQQFPHYKEPK